MEQQLDQKEDEFYMANCKADFVNAAKWTSTQKIGSVIFDFLSTGPQSLTIDFLMKETHYSSHTCRSSMYYYAKFGRIRKLDNGEYCLSGYTERKTGKPQEDALISELSLFPELVASKN